MALTTIDGVVEEIARLEVLLTTIVEASERVARINEKAALIGRLNHLEQQAAQQGKKQSFFIF